MLEARLLILLSLCNGTKHGYFIMNVAIPFMTNGHIKITAGTMYRSLNSLTKDGLITEVTQDIQPSDARQRHYKITDSGRDVLKAEFQCLDRLVRIAHMQGIVPKVQS